MSRVIAPDHYPAGLTAPGRSLVEITDLIWGSHPESGARLPVRADEVIARLDLSNQRRAIRIVQSLPSTKGILDEAAVDALLLRVHCELQRLGEEVQLPRRVAEALTGWIGSMLEQDPVAPVRVVDVGCGLGHIVRWLAAHRCLGPRVELIGADLNPVLIARASALAEAEDLECRFVVADAFEPGAVVGDPARTIVVSTGLLHHIAARDLPAFFQAHQQLGVQMFAHWDISPGPWATAGAWMFHQARMREAVSRHDGVMSARRAHSAGILLAAARQGAPDYRVDCNDGPTWRPCLSDVLRPLIGQVRAK